MKVAPAPYVHVLENLELILGDIRIVGTTS